MPLSKIKTYQPLHRKCRKFVFTFFECAAALTLDFTVWNQKSFAFFTLSADYKTEFTVGGMINFGWPLFWMAVSSVFLAPDPYLGMKDMIKRWDPSVRCIMKSVNKPPGLGWDYPRDIFSYAIFLLHALTFRINSEKGQVIPSKSCVDNNTIISP